MSIDTYITSLGLEHPICFPENTTNKIVDFIKKHKDVPFFVQQKDDGDSYDLRPSYAPTTYKWNNHFNFIEAHMLKEIINIIKEEYLIDQINLEYLVERFDRCCERYIIRVSQGKVSVVKLPLGDYLFEEI